MRRGGGGPEQDSRELNIGEQREKARDIVVRQLAMMDRSRAQLSQALSRRGISEEVARETLQHFEELGLIDDVHFARVLTRTRFAERGASRRAILDELQRKGVARGLAEEAVSVIDTEEEHEAAVGLAMKKLRAASGNPDTLVRRTYAMLARRGFGAEQCSRALREAESRLGGMEQADQPAEW